MSLLEKAKSWFAPVEPLHQEMLHYQTPPDAEQQYRLHLRIEKDGRGLLIVNAATILHLNQTAAEYARLLIQEASVDEAAQVMARRYRVGRAQAREDYERLREHILTLSTTTDLDPVTYLDMERATPFSAESSAPYRVDLALTYRVDEAGTLDPEARHRVDRELTTDEWRCAMWMLWEGGVPHICFTGGEPTLRDDLVELIRYAEKQGMVTGLLTDGRRLRDLAYLDQLLLAGLDHLQITLLSHRPEVHDEIVGYEGAWQEVDAGLRNALDGDIYVVVHIVIWPENVDSAVETIGYLAELGVPAVALSSPLQGDSRSEEEKRRLREGLEAVQKAVYTHALTLVWDLTAPYSHVNPVEVEAGLSPEQVVRQHLYVEPDGDVLPAQGYNVVLGNLLRDEWTTIWHHPEREKLGRSASDAADA
ncbi:MAG TPA: radical SAM protein [Chloroflexi bacterium]|nr:radical SAM protein [Chloroflexota bacterium]